MYRRSLLATSVFASLTLPFATAFGVKASTMLAGPPSPPEPVPQALGMSTQPLPPDEAAVFALARELAVRAAILFSDHIIQIEGLRRRADGLVPSAAEGIRAIVEARTIVLIDHLLENFEGVPDRGQVQALVHKGMAIDVLHEDTLAAMDDALIPFAVLRQLVHREGIITSTRTMPRLCEFLTRYTTALMPA